MPRVYVAAFSSPVVEGMPQACDILDSPGPYRLRLPDGIWFVRAAAVATREIDDRPPIRRPVLIGLACPVRVQGGQVLTVDLSMRALGMLDLPILLALPELDSLRLPKAPDLASVG
jgi:AraC family transcriptional regulator